MELDVGGCNIVAFRFVSKLRQPREGNRHSRRTRRAGESNEGASLCAWGRVGVASGHARCADRFFTVRRCRPPR
eukprot:3356992-Prymnesium_polylepis.1